MWVLLSLVLHTNMSMSTEPPPAKRRQTNMFAFFTVQHGQLDDEPVQDKLLIDIPVSNPTSTDVSMLHPQDDPDHTRSHPEPTGHIISTLTPTSANNDIGLAVGCRLETEHRAKFIHPWRPLSQDEFPSSVRQGRQALTKQNVERRCRLLPRHLDAFPWLAISNVQGKKGAFCISCVLFTASETGVGGRAEGHGQLPGKLVSKPLDRFDDLTGKNGVLTRHQITNYHQRSVIALDAFKKVLIDRSQLDICSHLDKEHQKAVEQNRAYLIPIVDTILTCARQNIAFRGHRGESGSVSAEGFEPIENDGNFRALLRYRLRGGDMSMSFQAHVKTANGNATYQSPSIQNAIISSCFLLLDCYKQLG